MLDLDRAVPQPVTIGMRRVPAKRRLQLEARDGAVVAFVDVVQALIFTERDGAVMAQTGGTNRHRGIIGAMAVPREGPGKFPTGI